MALQLINPPAAEPVTLADAKKHLNVVFDTDDAYISALITAAREALDGPDGILGRALMPQTWELVFDSFPQGPINIPLPPLQSVASVKYLDVLGAEQTVPTTDYVVDTISKPGWIAPATVWPSTYDSINTVRIRFVAGYADAASVPRPLWAAMLLQIGDIYENRQTGIVGTIHADNPAYDRLTFPYRIKLLG